jgi:hypothetical protein
MRSTALIIIALTIAVPASGIAAPAEQGVTCPPDVKGDNPTVGRSNSRSLSDEFALSNGVICPPAALDRDMEVKPPGGGHLKVIPPPGAPGEDQGMRPK